MARTQWANYALGSMTEESWTSGAIYGIVLCPLWCVRCQVYELRPLWCVRCQVYELCTLCGVLIIAGTSCKLWREKTK